MRRRGYRTQAANLVLVVQSFLRPVFRKVRRRNDLVRGCTLT